MAIVFSLLTYRPHGWHQLLPLLAEPDLIRSGLTGLASESSLHGLGYGLQDLFIGVDFLEICLQRHALQGLGDAPRLARTQVPSPILGKNVNVGCIIRAPLYTRKKALVPWMPWPPLFVRLAVACGVVYSPSAPLSSYGVSPFQRTLEQVTLLGALKFLGVLVVSVESKLITLRSN